MSENMTKTCPACFHEAAQDPNPDEALCPMHLHAPLLLAALKDARHQIALARQRGECLSGRWAMLLDSITTDINKAEGGRS